MKNCAVILAGGEGKRMKSDKPKTLSEVLGRPMLCWVMSALRKAGIDDICVVKGFKKSVSKSIFQPSIFPLKACSRLKDSEQVTL